MSTTTATASPTRSGSTWAIRPGRDSRASSTSRCSPSWSSASTAASRSTPPATSRGTTAPAHSHAQHLGNSVSEIDPTYALQNAFTGVPATSTRSTSYGTDDRHRGQLSPRHRHRPLGPIVDTTNTQVDNAVNLRYQHRGVYQGDRRPPDPAPQPPGRHAAPDQSRRRPSPTDGRSTATTISSTGHGRRRTVGQPYYLPNGIADLRDTDHTTRASRIPTRRISWSSARPPPVGGRWGEAAVRPRRAVHQSHDGTLAVQPGADQLHQSGPGRLFVRHHRPAHQPRPTTATRLPARRGRRQLQCVRRPTRVAAIDRRDRRRRLLRRRRRLLLPGRADAAVRDAGRHQRHGRVQWTVAPAASAAASTAAPTTSAASVHQLLPAGRRRRA